MLDALSLLELQIGWGADEALDLAPVDRTRIAAAPVLDRALEPPVRSVPAAADTARGTVAPIHATPVRAAPVHAAPVRAALPPRGAAAAARALAEAATGLDALRAAMAGFDGCALRDTASHLVFATGDASRGLVVVGEVPDEEEDRSGQPFAGAAGGLLDLMLRSIGLERQDLLLAPALPWRPPGNRQPTAIEIATCLPFLQHTLRLARPRRVVLMGGRPARMLLGDSARPGPGWRSLAVPGLEAPVPVLAMRHPSYLIGHPGSRRDAWRALLSLRIALDRDTATITES
ncbi:uracil-DNA glycosylase [Rhizosaccharibacter radicis]|uniref:Type-4 uracil-DNA glycosylase n=1 Tax=Rhizosaccharibacter radicis TaxID=2782605 RepID=A0ABT1W025_9PROT|nr:uracil-DNA glycosylase [Acetobacteraceae bacterium KSS12]